MCLTLAVGLCARVVLRVLLKKLSSNSIFGVGYAAPQGEESHIELDMCGATFAILLLDILGTYLT